VWLVGGPPPAFDPDGPPDPVRHALERLLTRGLLTRDSTGHVWPDAARRWSWSADSLTLTFELQGDLRFTDGVPCSSAHFRRALVAGLTGSDPARRAWVLGAVTGVAGVRVGKPLPALGIAAPDRQTLVLHLARRDPGLIERLATPGASGAWSDRTRGTAWKDAVGLGPMRVAGAAGSQRLTLVTRARGARLDTLSVRFAIGAPRARSLLRAGVVDAVWPLPPALLDEPLPAGYRSQRGVSWPPRTLLLVLRADLPPTTRAAARYALAHAVNRADLVRTLGVAGRDAEGWMGTTSRDWPSFDARQVQLWLDRGKLGRSFHVTLAFDADGEGSNLARRMQGEWSRLGLYVDLLPLRGSEFLEEALHGRRAQLLLVDAQPPLAGMRAELATLVQPLRGGSVGAFRTGWRTREFDAAILPGAGGSALDPAMVRGRIIEELVALPIAVLDRVGVLREGFTAARLNPEAGLDFGPSVTPGGAAR